MVYFWFHLNKIIHACIIGKNLKIEKKTKVQHPPTPHMPLLLTGNHCLKFVLYNSGRLILTQALKDERTWSMEGNGIGMKQ